MKNLRSQFEIKHHAFRIASSSSSGATVAVPSFPTTMPAAKFDIFAASCIFAPAARATASVAITVSPRRRHHKLRARGRDPDELLVLLKKRHPILSSVISTESSFNFFISPSRPFLIPECHSTNRASVHNRDRPHYDSG